MVDGLTKLWGPCGESLYLFVGWKLEWDFWRLEVHMFFFCIGGFDWAVWQMKFDDTLWWLQRLSHSFWGIFWHHSKSFGMGGNPGNARKFSSNHCGWWRIRKIFIHCPTDMEVSSFANHSRDWLKWQVLSMIQLNHNKSPQFYVLHKKWQGFNGRGKGAAGG